MLARLDELGIEHVRTSAASTMQNIGGTDPQQGRREDTGEHYTYIHDPDGNLIELVHHPLGLEDSQGRPAEGPTTFRGFAGLRSPASSRPRTKKAAPDRALGRSPLPNSGRKSGTSR